MNICKWTAQGRVTQKSQTNDENGRAKNIEIHLGDEIEEIVFFSNKENIIREVEKLKIGDKVRFTGCITPRKNGKFSSKPYFLNPTFLERLS